MASMAPVLIDLTSSPEPSEGPRSPRPFQSPGAHQRTSVPSRRAKKHGARSAATNWIQPEPLTHIEQKHDGQAPSIPYYGLAGARIDDTQTIKSSGGKLLENATPWYIVAEDVQDNFARSRQSISVVTHAAVHMHGNGSNGRLENHANHAVPFSDPSRTNAKSISRMCSSNGIDPTSVENDGFTALCDEENCHRALETCCKHRGASTPLSSEYDEPAQKRLRLDTHEPITNALLMNRPRMQKTAHLFDNDQLPPVVPSVEEAAIHTPSGSPWSKEEDALLGHLKNKCNLRWDRIALYFPNRTSASIQVRFSSKFARARSAKRKQDAPDSTDHSDTDVKSARRPRRRNAGVPATDGFVSWTEVAAMRKELSRELSEAEEPDNTPSHGNPTWHFDRLFPNSAVSMLRHRELGLVHGRAWSRSDASIPVELKNAVYRNYALIKKFDSASGDVSCMAWSPDTRSRGGHLRFAIGSIAISDATSMQYNRPYNLLLGGRGTDVLKELPEHHIERPVIWSNEGQGGHHLNPNSLVAMRNTQDKRLFMTVDALQFSSDGLALFSAGYDRAVRKYSFSREQDELYVENVSSIYQHAPVTHLTLGHDNRVAVACRHQHEEVQIFPSSLDLGEAVKLSRSDKSLSMSVAPCALRWGSHRFYREYLLAGYNGLHSDEDQADHGDTCLWHVETGQRLELTGVNRNVFDIAWNPMSSSSSTAFAIASSANHLGRRTKSVVQCYAANSGRWRPVIEWECPALDINDVIYCPHDDRLLAAGATDGRVYVWDMRFAKRGQKPVHVLHHGSSLNVLDPARRRDTIDTGVRFLSWGATSSRLFSGSSDGVVKSWNPSRSEDNAHVEDVVALQAGIMSGAFSPDYRDLLIGEERGHLNLLSLGRHDGDEDDDLSIGSASNPRFKIRRAPVPVTVVKPHQEAQNLLDSEQIVLRPMGNLPVRQAVQGPHYAGPYYRPSTVDLERAHQGWHNAQMHMQRIEHDRNVAAAANDPDTAEQAKTKAQQALNEATTLLESLQLREQEYEGLALQAAAHQRSLKAMEPVDSTPQSSYANRARISAANLRAHDAHHSERRIPGALLAQSRARPSADIHNLDCERLYRLGLAPSCPHCTLARQQTSPALQRFHKSRCPARLVGLRAQLGARCEKCQRPTPCPSDLASLRPDEQGNDVCAVDAPERLCARCRFECFRCGRVTKWLDGSRRMACESCRLRWDLGVLGYDLVGESRREITSVDLEGKSRNENERALAAAGRTNEEDERACVLDEDELARFHLLWDADRLPPTKDF